ncbi:MAG: hypothetical protein IT377_27330 [Polyangiaceae bacterium]|nr:hypothetical protein [Polyangiaceae bacterium]
MTRLRTSLLLVSAFALVACGPQAPAKRPGTTPGSKEPGGVASGPAPDLSTVPAPASLVGVGRLGNPANVVDTLASWSKYPIDVRALIKKTEPEMANLLVFDAPIEVAVSLDDKGLGNFPQPFAVVSVGVSSVDGIVNFAKRQGQSARMLRPSVYLIAKGEGGPVCAVAPSVGKSPARLVCGDRQEDIDALLPYATRGLPSEALGKSELYIEIQAEPLRRRYAKELRQLRTMAMPFVMSELSMDSPRFDRALADAAHGLADEVLAVAEDVDKIRVEGGIDRSGGLINGTVSMKFKGQSSWTVQTMVDAAKRSKGVPEKFWKLPKDAEMATFGVGANAKRYEAIRKTMADLLDGALEKEKVPRKVRDQISELMLETWTTEGDVVYAHGEVAGAAASATATSAAQTRERIRSYLGWYVIGVDEKPAKYKGYLDKLVKLYNDAQLRQVVDKRLKVKPADLPKLSSRPSRVPGMPPGTTVYELNLPSAFFAKMDEGMPGAKKAAAVPALAIVMALVPDGDSTWVGLSADEKALNAKLLDMRKGGSSLAAREGIAPLKASRGVSGGYFTVGNLVKSLVSGMQDAGLGDLTKALSMMPHHGETPMLMWTTVTSDGGPGMVWTIQVPKAVVEDIGAVAPSLAAAGSGKALGGPAAVMPPPAPPVAPAPAPVRKP